MAHEQESPGRTAMAALDFLKEPTNPLKASVRRYPALETVAAICRWLGWLVLVLALLLTPTAIVIGVIASIGGRDVTTALLGLMCALGLALNAIGLLAAAEIIRLAIRAGSDLFETRGLLAKVLNELRKAKSGNETAEQ